MLVCAGDTVIKAEADLVSLSLEDIQMAFPNKKVTKDLWKKVVDILQEELNENFCSKVFDAVREAEAAVAAEESRILGALTALVESEATALRSNGDLLAKLDLTRAVADVAGERSWNYAGDGADGSLHLEGARHPLLQPPVVPMDLHLSVDERALVITGPNTGGKTVVLKARSEEHTSELQSH